MISSRPMNTTLMRKLTDNITLNALRYGGLLPKHQVIVDRHTANLATVLGQWDGRLGWLQPPPPNASPETVLELNYIVEGQHLASKEDIAFGISIDKARNHYAWWAREATSITGKRHSPEKFDLIADMSEGFLMHLKGHFDRARPYQLGPLLGKKIQMFVSDPRTPAYPSGHAFEAYLFALVLGDEHPRYAPEFLALADTVGATRIVGGVHYPTDITAGRNAAIIAHDIIRGMG
jgi:acid phosphatase (class A)